MSEISFALFDTPLGACGIAWTSEGLRGVKLPEASRTATIARLRAQLGKAVPSDPPPWVSEAAASLALHLQGTPQDFTSLPIDLAGVPAFHRKVYLAARTVPSGQTVTYGELAVLAGSPAASRAVGQALARNPLAVVVPCHRVLASQGRPGGFSAYGGIVTKAKLLESEGARLPKSPARPGGEQGSLFGGSLTLPFDAATAVAHVAGADRPLARLIDRVGPLRLKLQVAPSPCEALTEAILHQQITAKAAAAIGARLAARLGTRGLPSAAVIAAASMRTLRAAGLSKSKALALRDLAAKTLEGSVPTFEAMHALDDDHIVESLTGVRGIGRWTAEMLLIFRLGRPDVLPVDDYGIRKGFARTFRTRELPTPREVAARGERWRPYRTVASWYLWRSLELP